MDISEPWKSRRTGHSLRARAFFAVVGLSLAAPVLIFAGMSVNWTFYAPGAGGWMQGPMTAASRDAEGASNRIHTLDDVRTGKSRYVTLASANVMRGRWYCIGTVTYTSPLEPNGDGMTHTLQNVVGYVHDTGCAFNGTCSCGRLSTYCNGVAHPEKMDIAVGDFTGWGGVPAMNYVTRNRNVAPSAWQQISGLPSGSEGGDSSACGGVPHETGIPTQAIYRPMSIEDQPPGVMTQATPVGEASQTGQNCVLSDGTRVSCSAIANRSSPPPAAQSQSAPAPVGGTTLATSPQSYNQLPQPTPVSNLITTSTSTPPQSLTDLLAALAAPKTSTSSPSILQLNPAIVTLSSSIGSTTSLMELSYQAQSTAAPPLQSVAGPLPNTSLSTFTSTDMSGAPQSAYQSSSSLLVSLYTQVKSILEGLLALLRGR